MLEAIHLGYPVNMQWEIIRLPKGVPPCVLRQQHPEQLYSFASGAQRTKPILSLSYVGHTLHYPGTHESHCCNHPRQHLARNGANLPSTV